MFSSIFITHLSDSKLALKPANRRNSLVPERMAPNAGANSRYQNDGA